MRPLESTLILFNTAILILLLIDHEKFRKWSIYLPFAALIISISQILLEHLRWQMIDSHLITLVLCANSLWQLLRGINRERRKKKGWVIFGLTLTLLGALLAVILPVPKLPHPTGEYAVGTTSFFWEDEDRVELLSPQETDQNRQMMVQIWYPAEMQTDAQNAPYLDGLSLAGETIARKLGGFPFLFEHLELVKTNAYLNLPISTAKESYPVLIFSHGWTGFRAQNTHQAEELASRGYVVFAPDHTFGSLVSVWPNGKVILNNPALLPSNVSEEEKALARQKLGDAWVGDILFVLDKIEQLNYGEIDEIFSGHFDLEKVGFFGHSTGAGAAAEACWVDARCDAALAMDTWLQPYSTDMSEEGIQKPMLYMESETWSGNEENMTLFYALFENSGSDHFYLKIAGTKHYDFADIPLLSPLSQYLNFKGSINGRKILEINRSTAVEFFDTYLLKDENTSVELLISQYEEVEFIKE